MGGNSKSPTIEQATAVLRKEQSVRQKKFADEYEKLCEKYGCRLMGIPGFTPDGRVGVQLQVQPTSVESG